MTNGLFVRTFVAATLFAGSAALAQAVVGTSIVDGHQVELLNDNSWRYVDPASVGCHRVKAGLEFCGKALGWVPLSRPLSPEATASFGLGTDVYAVVIAEAVGTEDGMSLELLSRAAISNAALGAGVAESAVVVNYSKDQMVLGAAARTTSYSVEIDGMLFTFRNTAWVTETEATQFISWMPGGFDAATDAPHTDAVAALKSVE